MARRGEAADRITGLSAVCEMSELLTEKWLQDRLGKVTASRIADMLATTKTGWGASRRNYAAELISERTYGVQRKCNTASTRKTRR
jgi:hypothetical protein